MKNLLIQRPAYNTDTLKLMSTLYVNEAEDLPLLAGTLPSFVVQLLTKIADSLHGVTFAHKPESEIANGNKVILVRFNNERHYRMAIFHNLSWDAMVFASPYFNTSDLGNGSRTTISSVGGSGSRNTVNRDITKKCFQPDVRSIMKRISKVETVSAATYEQWCFTAQKDAIDALTAANESAAIARIMRASRWNSESLPDAAQVAAFHAMDSILRGTPLPPGVLSQSVVDSFSAAFKKVDIAREDDAAARGKTLVQVIKLKADKNFLVKCGERHWALEQLPDNVAVAAATLMTVGGTVLGVGAQDLCTNPALEMNMVLLIEGAL